MTDPMQEMVCPRCGSANIVPTGNPKGWPQWGCLECKHTSWRTETRAEYLAAHDDDQRDDPAVERAVGANTQEGE